MSGSVIPMPKKVPCGAKPTLFEKMLLMMTIIIIPLENLLPVVGGFSGIYILFMVLGGYVALYRLAALQKVATHPVFVSICGMIFIWFIVESVHPKPNYGIIFRFAQMIVGGVFVATLCRDRNVLQWAFYGYLVAGLWMAILLFLTSYGALSAASVSNFHDASRLRSDTFADNPLEANLNGMAKITGVGALVALALVLGKGSTLRRNTLIAIAGFCLLATFLTMSRSGLMAILVAGSAIMISYGIGVRVIVMVVILGISMLIWVPDAVLTRMSFSTEKSHSGKMEARAQVYTASFETFDQYGLNGVGAGNFWGPWGSKTRFWFPSKQHVIGPHNSFIAVTIYWGMPGLLSFLFVLYQAYRCLPRKCGSDVLTLCLLGLSVALVMNMMSSHVLAAKPFSLGLGLLVGYQCWIRPKKGLQSVARVKIDDRYRGRMSKKTLEFTAH